MSNTKELEVIVTMTVKRTVTIKGETCDDDPGKIYFEDAIDDAESDILQEMSFAFDNVNIDSFSSSEVS